MKFGKLGVIICLICLCGFAGAEETGVIRGRVTFVGKLEPAEPLKISGSDYCEQCDMANPIPRNDVILNKNGTLKNVVVWIDRGGTDDYIHGAVSSETLVMNAEHCQFSPHVVALRVGQKLEIGNNDPILLNVNSYPKINQRFNQVIQPGGEPYTVSFTEPEIPVRIKSDIHPWMNAYVVVFDHAGFAVTDENGQFEIKGLTPGEYQLKAWQEKFGIAKAYVLLQKDKSAEVRFTYTTEGSRAGAQTKGGRLDSGTSVTESLK